MQQLFTLAEKLLKAENPLWLTISLGILFQAIIFILSPTSGSKLIDLLLLRRRGKQKKKYTRKYFMNHPIYDYFTYNLSRLRTLDFGNEGKTNAIKDMLYLLYTTYHASITQMITEGLYISDKYEFKELIKQTLLRADEDYLREWGKLKIKQISQLAHTCYHYQAQSIVFTQAAITNIVNSEIYDSVPERMHEILAIVETRFRVTMPDIEKGMSESDDHYNDLNYKSIFFK